MQITLVDRVEELIRTGRRELNSATPRAELIAELGQRLETLEHAVREIALDVQSLKGRSTPLLDPSVARRFRHRR